MLTSEEDFEPFTLEVNTLAEAVILKAKLDMSVDTVTHGVWLSYDDLNGDKGKLLREADLNLFDRVEEGLPMDLDDAFKLLGASGLDEDGEFRLESSEGDIFYVNADSLPSLRRAIQAFENAGK